MLHCWVHVDFTDFAFHVRFVSFTSGTRWAQNHGPYNLVNSAALDPSRHACGGEHVDQRFRGIAVQNFFHGDAMISGGPCALRG